MGGAPGGCGQRDSPTGLPRARAHSLHPPAPTLSFRRPRPPWPPPGAMHTPGCPGDDIFRQSEAPARCPRVVEPQGEAGVTASRDGGLVFGGIKHPQNLVSHLALPKSLRNRLLPRELVRGRGRGRERGVRTGEAAVADGPSETASTPACAPQSVPTGGRAGPPRGQSPEPRGPAPRPPSSGP